MAFDIDPTPTTSKPEERLAHKLVEGLQAARIPIKPGSATRWSQDIKQMLRSPERTEAQVQHVLDWVATKHNDQFTTKVRSGSALRTKFERLLKLSGWHMVNASSWPVVDDILMTQPLGWPFEASGERAWLCQAAAGMHNILITADQDLYHFLGPVDHCLRVWRLRKNSHAVQWQATSFAELQWAPTETAWTSIIEGGIREGQIGKRQ